MPKHDWVLDEYGNVDIFQYEQNMCNGPRCKECGLCACHHCNPEIYDEECPGEED